MIPIPRPLQDFAVWLVSKKWARFFPVTGEERAQSLSGGLAGLETGRVVWPPYRLYWLRRVLRFVRPIPAFATYPAAFLTLAATAAVEGTISPSSCVALAL